jgi:hypothetical protein
MKLVVEGSLVKMIPETDHEDANLNALWQILVRCDADSKVLCPVGQYVPGQGDTAAFAVQDQ